MKKRIISIFAALLVLCNGSAFAKKLTDEEIEQNYLNDAIDMNRVYEYDYNVTKEEPDTSEQLEHRDAVNIVRALGLMKNRDDGTFDEKGAVSYKDFAEIVMTLVINEKIDGAYDQYASEYTSMGDASYYLTAALGYNVYDVQNPADKYRETKARRIGLFKGIDFNAARNITRGELAQMIYNALDIDVVEQTGYVNNEEYRVADGRTLMAEVFDGVIVKGVVTAQNGMDIYTGESKIDDDRIEIDRMSYRLGNADPDDVFGHYVVAAALRDSSDDYTIAGVFAAENDPTLEIDTDDVTLIDSSKLRYEDGANRRSADIGALERVVYNGEVKNISDFNMDMMNCSGSVRLCVSEKNGDFVTAVVSAYSTFIVTGYSKISEKISLANGMQYMGQGYIDVNEDKTVTVFIDGKKSDLSSVKPGMVVSVLENPSGKSVELRLSTASVKGAITAINDDGVTINETVYKLSDAYAEVLEKDSKAIAVKSGKEGTFLLDSKNKIVKFTKDNDTELGYLMNFAVKKGISGEVSIKIFSERNEFEYLKLAKKLTLDGKKSVSCEDAYNILEENSAEVNKALIRFKLDDEGKVSYLDTLMRDSGGNTNESVSFDATFSGTMDWTAASRNYTNLEGTYYKIKPYTQVFEIPSDESSEGDFVYRAAPSYASGDKVNFELYNVNDFGIASAMIERVNLGDSSEMSRGDSYLVVLKVLNTTDEDGNERYKICGFDGTTPPKWMFNDFYVYESLDSKAAKLKKGDIIKFVSSGTEIRNMMVIVSADDFGTDYSGSHGMQEWLGTVERVSVEDDIVMVKIKDELRGFAPHSVGLYDTQKKEAFQIEFSDIQAGDRIFAYGGSSLMRLLVIR